MFGCTSSLQHDLVKAKWGSLGTVLLNHFSSKLEALLLVRMHEQCADIGRSLMDASLLFCAFEVRLPLLRQYQSRCIGGGYPWNACRSATAAFRCIRNPVPLQRGAFRIHTSLHFLNTIQKKTLGVIGQSDRLLSLFEDPWFLHQMPKPNPLIHPEATHQSRMGVVPWFRYQAQWTPRLQAQSSSQ